MTGPEATSSISTSSVNYQDLTDEQLKELGQSRIDLQTTTRNQALTNAISGTQEDSIGDKLEIARQEKLSEIREKQNEFDNKHAEVQTMLSDYTQAMKTESSAKRENTKFETIYNAGKNIINNFQKAYTSFTSGTTLSNIDIKTPINITDENAKKYLIGQIDSKTGENQSEQTELLESQYVHSEAYSQEAQARSDLNDALWTQNMMVEDLQYENQLLRTMTFASILNKKMT